MNPARIVLLALTVAFAASPALAQSPADVKARIAALKPKDFPSQPIELVVTTPAGGGMDVTARIFAKYMEKYTDQRVIVTNRVGAGGFVGYTWLATQAPNDGSVVGIIGTTILGDSFLRAQGKWTYKDVEPIALINYEPVTWIVSTEGQFKSASLADVLKTAKDKPSTIRVAIAATTILEMLAEQTENVAGLKLLKVPFQGGAPAITALLGQHIDISFGFFGEYRGHLEANKVRVLAVASQKRSPYLSDVPTFNEVLGVSNIEWISLRYVGLPKGVAADRKAYLLAVINATLDEPALLEEYKRAGAITDRTRFDTSEKTTAEVERLAVAEREFYVKSGRLKP